MSSSQTTIAITLVKVGVFTHLFVVFMYVLAWFMYMCFVCISWLFVCCGLGCFGDDYCCFRCFVLAYFEGVFLRGFHGFCDGITHP